jgi:hypothetical protein
MPVRQTSTLFAQLLNTGLQQKDNALYQVIYNLIAGLVNVQAVNTNTIEVVSGLTFTPGSILYAGLDGRITQDNANLFYNAGDPTLQVPKIAGGANIGAQLLFYGAKNNLGNNEPFKWFTNTNPASPNQMSLFSTGTLCVAGGGATPVLDSLGSGGVFMSAIHQTASGGFQAASRAIGAVSDIGYIDFGTFGTPSIEKRVAAIHGFLTASAAATPTGELRFYTTKAGAISEGFALTENGKIRFNSTRGVIFSPADNQFTFEANNGTTGFALQSGTNDAMLVANHANSAFGEVLALQYRLEAANKLYWNGRTAIRSSVNAFLEISNAALTQGFGIQAGVDTLVVANLAQNAYGTVDAGEYKLSGSSGLIATSLTFPGRYVISTSSNGILRLTNSGATAGFGLHANTVDTMTVANQANNAFGTVDCLDIKTENATFVHRTGVALTNNAAGNLGTLNNSPTAGNPTKWIAIDDNGTTRFIPAW